MVDDGWFTEEEYGAIVEEVESALSHLGGFMLDMTFFATGIVK